MLGGNEAMMEAHDDVHNFNRLTKFLLLVIRYHGPASLHRQGRNQQQVLCFPAISFAGLWQLIEKSDAIGDSGLAAPLGGSFHGCLCNPPVEKL
jgi:hypothetical protein